MLNKLKLKRITSQKSDDPLKNAKKNIYARSIGLAVFVIFVTVTLLFAVTTAWFTNTIAVDGLTFKAEAWGFDGTVSVSETAIEAAPGDEGYVELRVKNKSDLASSIGVSISKEYMEEAQMQKRIYFYVDKSSVVNGETVEKLYLNNTTGYSYTLYGHNELILSEELRTDVPIKWKWVYDVVGYYFKGTVTDTGVTVSEYLRPVEYSYDDATYEETKYDDAGNITEGGDLITVDGETTVPQFLAQLTASDGYEGAYSEAEDGSLMYNDTAVKPLTAANCWPIDEANGVWLYLCTKAEIEANTGWDTLYGTTAASEKKSYQARITVTGQQLNQEVVTLDGGADLAAAINSNSGDIVRLSNDITTVETIAVGSADTYVNAVVDLNGCKINVTDTELECLFTVSEGSTLTLFNGTLSGVDDSNTIGVKAVGSEVTLSNITVSKLDMGVRIEDNAGSGVNSTVIISDCEMTTTDCTVRINGNGALSSGNTQLVVQDSTLISEKLMGISGNGSGTTAASSGNWGTNIQVVNSTVEGYYTSIYHPQMNSTLSVSGSVLRGMTGLIIKGGDIRIADSTVIGTATDDSPITATPTEDQLGMSGSLDTGDGIYIESNYGYPITLTVSGDSVINHTAKSAQALRVFPAVEHVDVTLTGGTYSSNVNEYLDEGYICESKIVTEEGGESVTVYKVMAEEN